MSLEKMIDVTDLIVSDDSLDDDDDDSGRDCRWNAKRLQRWIYMIKWKNIWIYKEIKLMWM